jgi:predicted Fe-Mo cluster-binding NifX family protein
MKMCLSATADNLEAEIDPRLGRCAYLLIVDPETMQFKAIPNLASDAHGGAGIQAAQIIANLGVKIVITGNVGPNAFRALSASGIEVVTGVSGSVRQAISKFVNGELQRTSTPTVIGHLEMRKRGSRGIWRL